MSRKFAKKALGKLLKSKKTKANYDVEKTEETKVIYVDDVIIYVGEEPNIKEFHAHSNILRARSPYFKNLLSTKIQNKNNVITINKPNITSPVFEMILK